MATAAAAAQRAARGGEIHPAAALDAGCGAASRRLRSPVGVDCLLSRCGPPGCGYFARVTGPRPSSPKLARLPLSVAWRREPPLPVILPPLSSWACRPITTTGSAYALRLSSDVQFSEFFSTEKLRLETTAKHSI